MKIIFEKINTKDEARVLIYTIKITSGAQAMFLIWLPNFFRESPDILPGEEGMWKKPSQIHTYKITNIA